MCKGSRCASRACVPYHNDGVLAFSFAWVMIVCSLPMPVASALAFATSRATSSSDWMRVSFMWEFTLILWGSAVVAWEERVSNQMNVQRGRRRQGLEECRDGGYLSSVFFYVCRSEIGGLILLTPLC